jgi:hypothetical protein
MLLSIYSQPVAAVSLDSLTPQLLPLFQSGNSSQARFLLDSSELRFGPWDAPTQQGLSAVHLLVLLCEDDVAAARFLAKRSLLPKTTAAFQVYEKLWDGDAVGALELVNATLPAVVSGFVGEFPFLKVFVSQ